MAFTFIVKNSSTVGKEPTASQIERGELALNLADQKLYSKDANDQIFEIGAAGDTPSGGTSDRPTGAELGDLYFDTDLDILLYWNGSEWVPVGTEAIALDDLTDVTIPDNSLENGQILIYDDTTKQWGNATLDIPPGTIISDTAPADPEDGQLWWADSDEVEGGGRLYVWTGTEWVDTSLPGIGSDFGQTEAEGLFLSKVNDDTAAGAITFEGQTTHEAGVNVTGGDLTVAPGKILVLSDESVGVSSNLTSGNTNKAIKAFQVGSQTGVTAEEIYAFQVSGNLNTNATATTRLAAFQSGISDDGTDTRYNIDIQGNAPNQFKGQTIVSGTDLLDPMNATTGSGIRLNPNGRQETVITSTTASVSCFYMNRNNVAGKDGYFIRFGTDTDFSKVAGVRGNGTGGASFVEGSDYRLKENIVDMPSAVDTVKNLRTVEFNYKDYPGKTRKGFIAHELQQHVAEAVFGTEDETEVIGTVTDWDGTELETEVTEPPAEELTYEEQVEVTPYVAAVDATYDEEGNELTPAVPEAEATYETVTRTKTWTATGDRPVYQAVDQTKLIPILTKALQEVIAKNEDLEARLAALEGA